MADDIEARSVSVTMGEEESRSVDETVATETTTVEQPTITTTSDQIMVEATITTTTIEADNNLIENHSMEMVDESAPVAGAATDEVPEVPTEEAAVTENLGGADNNTTTAEAADAAAAAGLDDDGDVEMSDHHEYSDDGSEYEPENDTPPPAKIPKTPKQKSPTNVKKTPTTNHISTGNNNNNNNSGIIDTAYGGEASNTATPEHLQDPQTPQGTRIPKTPGSRVRSGRVEKSGGSPGPQGNLRCPVKGCGQTFTGRNPRQSLWHHLKYYATRGLPDRAEFEKSHGEAHAEMKRDAGKIHGT